MLDVTDGNGNVRSLRFDKVVVANGANHSPKIPTLEGLHKFKGSVIHSVGFKRSAMTPWSCCFLGKRNMSLTMYRPQDFKDLRVLVVGIGNTAADTATSLIGHAKSIHLGHRTGSFVVCIHHSLSLAILRELSYHVERLVASPLTMEPLIERPAFNIS